ncbi:MAG: hypothetical protein Q9159_007291 [Coniocarpon cinnabarinum]
MVNLVAPEGNAFQFESLGSQYEYWCLEWIDEETDSEAKGEYNRRLAERDRWGPQLTPPIVPLELISPILPPSIFREIINPVWTYLPNHYEITSEGLLTTTHVHLATTNPVFSLPQLQLIAAAAIHWEPAWEAVIPWRGNRTAKSVFMENRHFAPKRVTRAEAIEELKAQKSREELIDLMSPTGEKFWGFNFLNCSDDGCQTVEFRRGSLSTCKEDVIMWISVANSFMLAALACGSVDAILRATVTVHALEQFMMSARDVFHEADIKRLYTQAQARAGSSALKTDRPLVTGKPWIEEWTSTQLKNMHDMTAADVGM